MYDAFLVHWLIDWFFWWFSRCEILTKVRLPCKDRQIRVTIWVSSTRWILNPYIEILVLRWIVHWIVHRRDRFMQQHSTPRRTGLFRRSSEYQIWSVSTHSIFGNTYESSTHLEHVWIRYAIVHPNHWHSYGNQSGPYLRQNFHGQNRQDDQSIGIQRFT